MLTNDNGNRFTNEIYATKSDVSSALNTVLIDRTWEQILDYRSNFSVVLPLKNIDGSRYSICLAPSIVNKVNSCERKLNKFIMRFSTLGETKGKEELILEAFSHALKHVSDNLHISIDDNTLKIIAGNNISAITPDKLVIQKYANVLNKILKEQDYAMVNDPYTFIAKLCEDFLGLNIDNIYRTRDNQISGVYSNLYSEAPHSMIESLMDGLFEYFNSSDQSVIIKICVLFYFILYIKPFDSYNEEIASLAGKYILLNSDLDGACSLINLEFICDSNERLTKLLNETQKSCDLTYFVNECLKIIDENLQPLIDDTVKASANDIKSDYFQQENPQESKPIETKTLDSNLIKDEKKLDVTNDISSVKSENNFTEGLTLTRQSAITNLTVGYSEEKAKQVEEYLVESNPNLTISQAYFYARHCTLGNFYTISQYKRSVGCAYETARTSMDKLVTEGYYSKESYKNKFLYTPIRRK